MGDTIVGVQFGIANPDNLAKRSVVEVTTDKTYQSNQPVPNGVFDAGLASLRTVRSARRASRPTSSVLDTLDIFRWPVQCISTSSSM